MNFDVIETIEKIFHSVDDRVIEWLYGHEWQIPFLIRAYDSVQEYYGEGTRVFLSVETDYHSGEDYFWFNINARQDMNESHDIYDKFLDEFWFEHAYMIINENHDINPGFNFTPYMINVEGRLTVVNGLENRRV